MRTVDAIETYFRDYFRAWEIELPPDAVAARKSGHLFERGWHIGYVWGRENSDEYLEVLAQHRMTNDRHFKVFASGRVEDLPAPADFMVYPRDASESERQELHDEYVETNRRIYADLRQRGLLPPQGANLASLEINEYLRSEGAAEPSESG